MSAAPAFRIGDRVTIGHGRGVEHGLVTRVGCDAGHTCRWLPAQCFTILVDGARQSSNPNPATLTPEVPAP